MGPGLLLLFVVGDILGTGIYALTGQVATRVGGAVWMPFVVAFQSPSYGVQLPGAGDEVPAGRRSRSTHKAFGVHFLTFIVAFTGGVLGHTSASTASRAFAANLGEAFDLDLGDGVKVTLVALAFITLIAIVNFRGVGESVKANVVLTCVELSGLLPIVFIGLWALGGGGGDFSHVTQLQAPQGQGLFGAVTAAAGLAFFAMVGFEDLGEHGRGVQGPGPDLSQGHAHRPRHHGDDLRPGLDHGSCPGAAGSARRGRHPVAPGRRGRCSGLPIGPVRVHRHVRGGELGADQHADGQSAALRHESGKGAA